MGPPSPRRAGSRGRPLPLRSSGRCVRYVRRGAPTRPAAPTAPPPGVARLPPFVCPEPAPPRRCSERLGHAAFQGELSTGCEVTLLQTAPIGWHAPPSRPQPGAYFPLPPASPLRRLCASVARLPPAPLPARVSLEGFVPAEVGGGGRGKLRRVVGVASCFPNLPAR